MLPISIHAPHAGCDYYTVCKKPTIRQFQSTHPMRGATCRAFVSPLLAFYFNPRTPCGVRHKKIRVIKVTRNISIHAPHAGCDTVRPRCKPRFHHFNPRTPCGVRLPSALRATRPAVYFNPRTPCGVRPNNGWGNGAWGAISIHAPHGGCDRPRDTPKLLQSRFQSTHPMRGAT